MTPAVTDRRRLAFFWITVAETTKIREQYRKVRVDGRGSEPTVRVLPVREGDPGLSQALAVYQALVEIANEGRSREDVGQESEEFAAARSQIAEYAGCSAKTVDRVVTLLERVSLVRVTRRKRPDGKENLPSLYVLISAEGGGDSESPGTDSQSPGGGDSESQKREEVTTEDQPPTPSGQGEIRDIFDFWVTTLGKRNPKFSPKRRKAIKARLAEGFTAREIAQAIRGVTHSPHNMGTKRDSKRAYNDLTLICRDPEHVEEFRDLYLKEKGKAAGPTAGERQNARRERVRREQEASGG